MSKNNLDIFFDFGSSKIRISAFGDENNKDDISIEEDCITLLKVDKLQFLNFEKIFEDIIFKFEKKSGEYMDSVNLMFDTADSLSINFSVTKSIDNEKLKKEDIKNLIQDAKQQVLKFNSDFEIVHIIITNYKLDNKDFIEPTYDIECNSLSIDILFICYPKKTIKILEDIFNKNQISIKQILCSSYAKSSNYIEQFVNFDKVAFIDLGYEKTSISVYEMQKLKSFNVLPIGGNHITKDISKVLKYEIKDSETKKINFNSEFSKLNKSLVDTNKNQAEPIKMIGEIISARVEEILNLSLKTINLHKNIDNSNKFKIILTGEGSKILNNNLIQLKEVVPISEEIIFFRETNLSICQSGLNLKNAPSKQEVVMIPRKQKRTGLFEKLFHFFK